MVSPTRTRKSGAAIPETAEQLAVALGRRGISSVSDIAGASLASLCAIRTIDAALASALRREAQALTASNETSDRNKSDVGISLGVLSGAPANFLEA